METWERDLKLRVDEIVAIFADQETPLAQWLRSVSPTIQGVLTKATRSQIGIYRSLLPYLPSGRTGQLPLPAQTREQLGKVRDDAIRLINSLQAALDDPLMQVALFAGFFIPVALKNDQRISFPEGRQEFVQQALDEMATDDRTGLAGVRLRLSRSLRAVQFIRATATTGITMRKGRQLKVRPPKMSGCLPALLVLITAQHFAPPPASGAGVEEWRSAVDEFYLLIGPHLLPSCAGGML